MPDRKNRRGNEYKYIISDSCIEDTLTDGIIERGLNGAANRSILGGIVVKVLIIQVVNCDNAILGESVLDRDSPQRKA